MKREHASQSGRVYPRVLLSVFICFSVYLSAAALAQNAPQSSGIQVVHSYHNDVSPALRDLPSQYPPKFSKEENEREMIEANLNPKLPLIDHVDVPDPIIDRGLLGALVPNAMPDPILNFDGMFNMCGCAPPDTNGAVGLTQYVQNDNASYQVFDKATGASVLGPATIESIWSGFGGVCETRGFGDPVVLYDHIANGPVKMTSASQSDVKSRHTGLARATWQRTEPKGCGSAAISNGT